MGTDVNESLLLGRRGRWESTSALALAKKVYIRVVSHVGFA